MFIKELMEITGKNNIKRFLCQKLVNKQYKNKF